MSVDIAIAVAGALLLGGAFSNKISSRFNLPALLLFLVAGVLADMVLPVNMNQHAEKVNFFGILAMSYILYSGGLETDLFSVARVIKPGLMLAGPAVLLTALLTGAGSYLVLGGKQSIIWCLLLGALISSTDAAAVFSILRGRSVRLKGDLQPLLEFESGSNDPMAATLTLLLVSVLAPGFVNHGMLELPMSLFRLGGGILVGWLFGRTGKYLFKVKLEFEGLYFVISVALVLVCYGVAQLVWTNGFMACYICGVFMGNSRYNYKNGLRKFHNGFAWLMQVGLFIVLGFMVQPRSFLVPEVWSRGVVLGLLLMLVFRPAAVFVCLVGTKYSLREKIFIAWVGIRGAAPIVLATFPLAMGVEDAELMFRLIFFMVILSVVIQGWLLMPVARLLKLADGETSDPVPPPLELEITEHSRNQDMKEFVVAAGSDLDGLTLAEINFPSGVLVTMIRRNGGFISPHGKTVVRAGDGLLVIAETSLLRETAKKYFS